MRRLLRWRARLAQLRAVELRQVVMRDDDVRKHLHRQRQRGVAVVGRIDDMPAVLDQQRHGLAAVKALPSATTMRSGDSFAVVARGHG